MSGSVSVVVLAAGRSSRMGEGRHKLLSRFGGIPLVRSATKAALDSRCRAAYLVVGHRSDDILESIGGLFPTVVTNGDCSSGMAQSIRLGIEAVERDGAQGVMVMLADMPFITTGHLDLLIAEFEDRGAYCIVRATADGRPGNPIIFPRAMFGKLKELSGDVGARDLIRSTRIPIVDVECGRAAAVDVDTIEDVIATGGAPGA